MGVVRKLMGRTAEHERLQAVSFPRSAGVPVTCGSSTDGDRLQGRVERSGANAGFDAEGTITAANGTAPIAVRLSSGTHSPGGRCSSRTAGLGAAAPARTPAVASPSGDDGTGFEELVMRAHPGPA
jgi:hypothetical protein